MKIDTKKQPFLGLADRRFAVVSGSAAVMHARNECWTMCILTNGEREIFRDERPALGTWNRPRELAEFWVEKWKEAVHVYEERLGGSSSYWVYPQSNLS